MQAIRTVRSVAPEVNRTPPHEQVAAAIRADITSGRLATGAELPSVRRLAAEWGISPPTALRAVATLRDEGWVTTRPGAPAVVRADHPGGTDRGSGTTLE